MKWEEGEHEQNNERVDDMRGGNSNKAGNRKWRQTGGIERQWKARR